MKRWATWLASTRRVWWIWAVMWLLLTGVVVKTLPSLTKVASAQSTSFLPASAEPSVAQHYLNRIHLIILNALPVRVIKRSNWTRH